LALLPHFTQVGDDPAIIGQGTEDLLCGCGQSVLVKGFLPLNLLGIDVRCGRCGATTTTPGLPDRMTPPNAVIPIDRTEEPLPRPATVARLTALASREEIDRLTRLYSPRTPPSDICTIDAVTLEAVAADYDRCTGGRLGAHLTDLANAGGGAGSGLRTHALAWAIGHLRSAHVQPGWTCARTDAGSVATALIGAFQHFMACWSHHPLFDAMLATAMDDGFSLHAFAQFGAAKCLADTGNRVGFLSSGGNAARITGIYISIGQSEQWNVIVEPFDRFEWPHARPWDMPDLRAAAIEAVAASQARINPRHPGLLVLSAGAAPGAFDQPMVEAIGLAMQAQGRRNRGVGAVCAILPKVTTVDRPNAARFTFAFYPVSNRHFAGTSAPQIGTRSDSERR
jgi:hypothetical protein